MPEHRGPKHGPIPGRDEMKWCGLPRNWGNFSAVGAYLDDLNRTLIKPLAVARSGGYRQVCSENLPQEPDGGTDPGEFQPDSGRQGQEGRPCFGGEALRGQQRSRAAVGGGRHLAGNVVSEKSRPTYRTPRPPKKVRQISGLEAKAG